MATVPEAFVTLFEENTFQNDFSLRVNSNPCQFQDREGDAYSTFDKISVDLTVQEKRLCIRLGVYWSASSETHGKSHYTTLHLSPVGKLQDMSVIRDDYTFATTYQEIFHIPTRSFPLYGEADSCSFENDRYPTLMGNCPEPGTMVINTRGTGLKVDPSLTWQLGGYEPRIESFSRSADGHVIQAAIDGWCRYYTPSSTMFLHADSNDGQKGTASIPICPDL